jgi:hypothetical protein
MKDLIEILVTTVLIILLIDVIGFSAWAYTGQVPPDGCYVGSITAHILGR